MGTKTITRYISDMDEQEIAAGQAYQLTIRHPDGSTQQLDISAQNYKGLKLRRPRQDVEKARSQAGQWHRQSRLRHHRHSPTSEPVGERRRQTCLLIASMRLLSESLAPWQQAVAVRTSPNSEASGLGDVETTPRPPQVLSGRLVAGRRP